MKTLYKILIIGTLLTIALVLTTKLYIDSLINEKIAESQLDDKLFYTDFSYNLLTGNAVIENVTLQSATVKTNIDRIEIDGFSAWKYAMHKKIHCNAIVITNPICIVTSASKSKKLNATLPSIHINEVSIVKGSLVLKSDSNSVYAICEDFNLKLNDINNADSTSTTFPLQAKSIEAQISSYHSFVSNLHSLRIASIAISNETIQFTELELAPLNRKLDFQKRIPYEKDMLFLSIPKGEIDDYTLREINGKWQLGVQYLNIEKPNLIVYRDKNKKDDVRYKPLYSKQLRNLNVGLNIDSISVQQASVVYAELAEGKSRPGFARLNELTISATNMHNDSTKKGSASITNITAKSKIMKGAALDLDWQFDVNSLSDNFSVNGAIKNIEGDDLNMFLSPSYQANATGEISILKFDMRGNDKEALGSIKLNMNNLQIRLSSSKTGFKKIVVEPLINLVLHNKTKQGLIEENDIVVLRDQQKSFWNYIWSFISQGSIQAIT